MRSILRLVSTIVLLAFAVWMVRLLAHSKKPEPEGIWREMVPELPDSG
jgi:hypothetical protein